MRFPILYFSQLLQNWKELRKLQKYGIIFARQMLTHRKFLEHPCEDTTMTLTDVLTAMETQGHIPTSRLKDIQTSIRYLARALGKEQPGQCQQDDFLLSTAVWKEKLDTYFMSLDKPPSAHTIRNTRNNLSFLFRTAHDAGLIIPPQSLPLLHPTRRQHRIISAQTSPYRDRWLAARRTSYILPQHEWPADIQAAWHNYAVSRQLKTRQISLNIHIQRLSSYIGFLINIEGLSVQWDDLFQTPFLDRFIRWHSQQHQIRISEQARAVTQTLCTIASHLNHPSLPLLQHYRRDLPTPEPLHNKQHHGITLRELETIGLSALQDARKPSTTERRAAHAGLQRASECQRALMLRLLVRIPLRSRNLREIQLDKNLYKDQDGCWHLHFSGSELKIGTRNGRTNEYHVNLTKYCPDLLPHLEEFLTVYRPRIPQTETSSLLFRTWYGNPFTGLTIHRELAEMVLRCSNKRFYPHLIRTIWATEYLTDNPGDYDGAAALLGDTVQMVLKRYYELQVKDAHARASQFLTAALR